MTNPDFADRTYTAEVLRFKADASEAFKAILRLTIEPEIEEVSDEATGSLVKVCHAFLASRKEFHRATRIILAPDGSQILLPRQKKIRDVQHNLYDVYLAQCRNQLVLAVPFHELAEEFFLRADDRLGGTNARYEKLDITTLVIKLGEAGTASVLTSRAGDKLALCVTRCHLAYVDQIRRSASLQQLSMTGSNLGESREYRELIAPVIHPDDSATTVTPIVLGFALSANGVRKSSATTDRHGNFKVWIAPGLRRLLRLFDLLAALQGLKDVMQTTSNVPILQSRTIRSAEE